MTDNSIISTSVAPMHVDSSFSSEMVSQCLLWDKVEILESKDNWHHVQGPDGYDGWMHSFYLTSSNFPFKEEYVILDRFMPIFSNGTDMKSILMILSFATKVPVINKNNNLITIQLPNDHLGFMNFQHKQFNHDRQSVIMFAKSLMGAPYLWGGASSFGYDCSGFIQAIMKALGVFLKRDSSQQIKDKRLRETSMEDAQMADLIFFSENNRINHVGFLLGGGKIIHCSGQVKIESLVQGDDDFNLELSKYDKTFMSISNLINN